jgi:pimeloyl-ACP methyl ester carboxylesterase
MPSETLKPGARGAFLDIGGRRLRAVRAGPARTDRPLVLLEAGAFGFSADWAAVQGRLADRGWASLAYDRAGLGLSDPGPKPRDGLAIVRDLEALLAADGVTGPLIPCGHSMAGLHTHHFAVRHRAAVMGLVLVDATTPASMESPLVGAFVSQFANASRLAAWSAGAGLLAPLAGTPLGDQIGLGGALSEEKRWAFADAAHNHWAAEEVSQWQAAARQARDAGDLDPDWPVAVILAGPPESRGGNKTLQTAPALASRHGLVEHIGGASHATILSDLHAEAIVRGVEHVAANSLGR